MNKEAKRRIERVLRYVTVAALVALLAFGALVGCGQGEDAEPTEPPVTLIRSATETPTPTVTATPGEETPSASQAATPGPTEPYPLPSPLPTQTLANPYPTPETS